MLPSMSFNLGEVLMLCGMWGLFNWWIGRTLLANKIKRELDEWLTADLIEWKDQEPKVDSNEDSTYN
jgi:hypothetical protein